MPVVQVLVAASGGTEMQQHTIFLERNGVSLGDVYSADRISDELPGLRGVCVTVPGPQWRSRFARLQKFGDDAPSDPHTPRDDQHPEEKPD